MSPPFPNILILYLYPCLNKFSVSDIFTIPCLPLGCTLLAQACSSCLINEDLTTHLKILPFLPKTYYDITYFMVIYLSIEINDTIKKRFVPFYLSFLI